MEVLERKIEIFEKTETSLKEELNETKESLQFREQNLRYNIFLRFLFRFLSTILEMEVSSILKLMITFNS